ncbi:MAG: type II toxin-antitoxin system HipA family toxin [Gammaproteobacteria bacterium]
MTQGDRVSVLRLSLHDQLLGYLAGYQGGRNTLTFAETFRENPRRPTFSLVTHPAFPRAGKLLAQPWSTNQRLPPVLSNLLPEGALREFIAQSLKVHMENEFEIFSCLAADLPGALLATAMEPEDIPESVLTENGKRYQATRPERAQQTHKFSLAGVQMKFSMKERDGRYNFSQGSGDLGDWIIKTPSTRHRDVPLNEYTAMSLAALAGVDIPEIRLIGLEKLQALPPISLPDEKYAYGIKRFDRQNNIRIHAEDFAQVLVKYPHEKYNSASYEQIARILYGFSEDGLADVQQFAKRLLVNILLANGDAHLKNWSLVYPDQINPRLAPAYDIVSTSVYIESEREFALNLAGNKDWYRTTLAHFEVWAEKSGVPWRAIKPHIDDVMQKAREQWPKALQDFPMSPDHQALLRQHWRALHSDFRIG